MPTISGMRRRGYPPQALRDFCDAVGNSKRPQTIELSRLEHHVREHLNMSAPRVMGVLEPLKVVITNHPEGETELLDAVNNPEDASAGTRQVPFSRELWIEREDFLEDPPKKFFRLGPGREVRLRWGYFITCRDYKKDAAGNVVELHCTYDPETRGGQAPDGRKVKGTIHWVSAAHALDAQVRLYDTLFAKENAEAADEGKDWRDNFNPDSLVVLTGCKVEPSLAEAKPGVPYQFERKGYFVLDEESPSGADSLIFNRTVGLKDTWAKVQNK
jgi:glutaminyl-tRNA synthetase